MTRPLLLVLAWTLLPLVALASADSEVTPIDLDALDRAWQPLMILAGDGDGDTAFARLDEYSQLRERMIANMEVHPETAEFMDRFWASLERFDLQRLHELLPERESLEARALMVSGRSINDAYRIGPEAEVRNADEDNGALKLGDFDTEFRSLSLFDEEQQRFLLGIESTLAVGKLAQPTIARAAREYISAQTQPDSAFSGDTARYWQNRVSDHYPNLSDYDTEVLAPWKMAYPGTWDMLYRLGRIDGLVQPPENWEAPYQQGDAGFTLETDRIGKHYPGLARHLDRLGSLFRVEGQLKTDDGRLIGFSLDTDSLSGALEGMLHQGVPVATSDNGTMASTEATINALGNLTAVMDIRINVLGVIAHLNGLEADLSMSARDGGGDIYASITRMPEIEVEGRALGMMPTGFIDFFIPGSLEEIIEEFLQVATEGNQGQGITASIQIDDSLNGRSSVLGLEGNFEALDNFFVRLGMRMVNRRAVPDDRASEDIRRLIFDLNQSFGEDVERYEALSQP